MTAQWYVVATHPARDYRVRDELRRLGFEVLLLECKLRKRLRRAVVTLKGPLFPGYQFVRLDLALAHWQAIEGVRGVEGLLRHCDRPWPVRDGDIVRLRRMVEEQGGCIVIEGGAIRREFEAGEPVAIEGGPLDGWKGVYVERVKDRLKVVLDMFGRATETLVFEAQVLPA